MLKNPQKRKICSPVTWFNEVSESTTTIVPLPSRVNTKTISNILNTRKSVSSGIQTLRSGLKKRGAAELFFFLTNFEVFGYLMKHSFECLI